MPDRSSFSALSSPSASVPSSSPSAPAGAGGGGSARAGVAAALRRISSDSLFGAEAVEIEIEHRQQVYRLRRTALGKLILTK